MNNANAVDCCGSDAHVAICCAAFSDGKAEGKAEGNSIGFW